MTEFSGAASKNPTLDIFKNQMCFIYFSEYDHEEDYVEFERPKEMFIEKIFHGKIKKLVNLPGKLPQWVNKVCTHILSRPQS